MRGQCLKLMQKPHCAVQWFSTQGRLEMRKGLFFGCSNDWRAHLVFGRQEGAREDSCMPCTGTGNLKGGPKGYAIQSVGSLVLISLGWVNS